MSSFFSRSSTKSANSASSSLHSKATTGKEAPPPTHEIYTSPLEGIHPSKKWEYDEEQLQKIHELQEYTATLLLPESDPYHVWEKRFLSDPGCHPRYMRAAKWKMHDAKTRIKGTIEWRREFKPDLIKPSEVGVESETGKIILSGFDLDARPILYLRPGRENTETSPRQIQHLIYMLERAIDFMPPGQEQVAIIVDYKSATSSSNVSIGTGRKVLSILQNHYVERLGRGLVINMPWWINAFFAGISPLMDPITRDKIRFNAKLTELCPEDQLDFEFGGTYNLDFEFDSYWKKITEFCCLAPDGTRVDKNDKAWIPPLGNGIQAAVDGLVPAEGATQTGEVVQKGDAQAGKSTSAEKKQDPTPAQLFAAEARRSMDPDRRDMPVVDGMNNMSISGSTDSAGVPEPPSTTTKPGEPVGDGLVFDHEPSKDEVKEALKAVEA
ncbi:CRAL-TRIO domain-containing protein [Kockovaella imperatae]|uniref:CRAL-TRIO domain-containing protein n=1 Tax=Kockovaella imperatae TaxID=4999 RepID=A0A1Y1UHK9_9TREE|nr:CRAL-TRIO domain-containing protein [Kockovaella imperatae]ORX37550.1 CRAL-TRIO domain-containing protein [Kockovaella imperatae]